MHIQKERLTVKGTERYTSDEPSMKEFEIKKNSEHNFVEEQAVLRLANRNNSIPTNVT